MKNFPIVENHRPSPTTADIARVDQLAAGMRREFPQLALPDDFRSLVPRRIEEAPVLHLDDLTAIPNLDAGQDVRFYQERARLRAGDGDFVATSSPVAAGYESYCRDSLGLGAVQWLCPRPAHDPLKVAEACWEDERVRSLLVDAIRAGALRYMHPHMGTFAVWELAALLRDASGCPFQVIAPPPGISRWVNNKIAFAEVVTRLFGPEYVPRTSSAANLAVLASRTRDMANSSLAIGIKLPSSAGGDGTVVLDAKSLTGRSLRAVRDKLKEALPALNWSGESELLVDSWETEIISSPSAQLWIPSQEEGEPVVEGIFAQIIEGPHGLFVGSASVILPSGMTDEIVTRCWLLGRLFQQLGYLGRCSFDLILVGKETSARLEFIECNGRWGGTSAPMTLMNRLFGKWAGQPHVTRVCKIPQLGRMSFPQLLDRVGEERFDRTARTGHIILSIPGRMAARSAIDVIAIGDDAADAKTRLREFVERISHDRAP